MEQQKLKRKYGLITATALIVGTVVGSGIFFRTGRVLNDVGGNIVLGLLAWIVSGCVMFVCAYTFSMMANKYEKVNGIMDYSEELIGKKYSYGAGWFLAVLYGPTIAAIVAYIAADYTSILLGISAESYGSFVFAMTFVYIIFIFTINFFSPKIAGKFQVSTTVIKLIPLLLLGIVGIFLGIIKGVDTSSLATGTFTGDPLKVSFFAGIVTTAYSYDGWCCIVSLNSEIKNSKRNMPIALLLGSIVIISVYVIYYLGISFAGNIGDLVLDGQNGGNTGTNSAFVKIFGNFGATILVVFVIISCLGAVNGNIMAANRMMFSLASRNWGIKPKVIREISKSTDVPYNSALISLVLSFVWVIVLLCSENGWFGKYYFDIGDIAAIGFYVLCVPIFVMFVIKEKGLQWYKRFLMPVLAILAALFMVVALFLADWELALIYIFTIVLLIAIGMIFYRKEKKTFNEDDLEEVELKNLEGA